jgi:hypothetical protein
MTEQDSHSAARPAPGLLGQAVTANDVEAVKDLLERGADVEDCTGLVCASPLTKAAMEGYLDIVRLLLYHCADINQPNLTNETPLIMAVSGRQPAVVAFLIGEGADTSLTDGGGATALDYARARRLPDIVQLLVFAPLLRQRRIEEKAHEEAATAARRQDTLREVSRRRRLRVGP